MTVQAITLNLPETVYEQIRRAAEKAQRPVNDVLVEAVTAVAPVIGTTSEKLRASLAQLWPISTTPLCGKPPVRQCLPRNENDSRPSTISSSEKG